MVKANWWRPIPALALQTKRFHQEQMGALEDVLENRPIGSSGG